jgi:hypothetical protein
VDLPVPCSYDFSVAATKYFAGLEEDTEASFRLPAHTWRELMDVFYPNSAWLCLRQDVFEALERYRSGQGLPTTEQALERLLAGEEAVTS